jgi:hypothetical protein
MVKILLLWAVQYPLYLWVVVQVDQIVPLPMLVDQAEDLQNPLHQERLAQLARVTQVVPDQHTMQVQAVAVPALPH